VPEKKISVVYEGYSSENFKCHSNLGGTISNGRISNYKKFLLFVGRLEERKNVAGIVDAFEMLKRKYNILQKLILVGKFGYGGEKIKNKINSSKFKNDIILTGYVSDENKYYLMANADAFLFPTFYEGFGLPILEAQSVGAPVVCSNVSSMPEICGKGAVLVDPDDAEHIAGAIHKLISDDAHRNDIIEKGLENVKRFSWEKCAEEVAELLSK